MKRGLWVGILSAALLLFLTPSFRSRIQANRLAVDLMSQTIAGERFLDSATGYDIARQLGTGPNPTGQRVAASWFCRTGVLERCASLYGAILQKGDDDLAAFHLADLLASEGREQEAITLWQQSRSGRYWAHQGAQTEGCVCEGQNDSLCLLQRAVTIAPSDGLSQLLLGERLYQCGAWEEAHVALTRALSTSMLAPQERFRALLDRADAAYHAGKGLETALDDLTQTMLLQPDNAWPYLRACSFYREEERLQDALASCERGVSLAPGLSFAYYYRGRVWHSLGLDSTAADDFRQALALDPALTSAAAWLERVDE
jgi:tetratricopeptide (TPR) repeat protein